MRSATAELPQLGERLRRRRLRRGLELNDVAAELELPSKTLRAVEWDRLDLLGSPSDADRTLRKYAAFLGINVGAGRTVWLDGEPPAPRRRERGLSVLLFAGAAAPLIAVLVYLLGVGVPGSADGESRGRQPSTEPPASTATTPGTTARSTGENAPSARARKAPAASKQKARPRSPAQRPVRFVLAAAPGEQSWIEARAGSPTGLILFHGTLADGRKLRLSGPRLWVRLGAASHLVFALNGRRVGSDLYGTVDVLVTPQGIRRA